jgi:hypothetical protein
MAKQKSISLKKVGAELDKVIKQLEGAKKKAGPSDKKKLDVHLKFVHKAKKDALARCRNSFALVPPGTPPSN